MAEGGEMRSGFLQERKDNKKVGEEKSREQRGPQRKTDGSKSHRGKKVEVGQD